MARDSLQGEVKFYDDATDWGIIEGDDGRLYAVRRAHVQGRLPRPGERVAFDPVTTFGGPRAIAVRSLASPGPLGVGGDRRSPASARDGGSPAVE